MRRSAILAALAVLALMVVPVAEAAVSKPLMTVEGNFIGTYNPSHTLFGRFEIRTTDTGKVEFGYWEGDGMLGAPGFREDGTVDSVTFFTDQATGAKGAEFTGTLCTVADPGNPGSVGTCVPYVSRVTDGGSKTADTFCQDPSVGTCYAWVVTGGDIRIFSQQQR